MQPFIRLVAAFSFHAALVRIAIVGLLSSALWIQGEAHGAQATLRWDYDTSGAAGFVLYCGSSSSNYSTRVDVGNTTTYTLNNLTAGVTYFCAVTAYDSSKVESSYSNEVSVAIPSGALDVNFTANPTTGKAPLTVTFSNATSGQVTSWAWNFGDGTSSTAMNPTHIYTIPGTYTVALTASAASGSVTKTAATPITVSASTATPPIVNFSASPTSGTAPVTVVFTNTTTGQVTSWAWNFGDGTSSTATSPTHVYSKAGTYSVVLTATGPGGTVSKTAAAAVSVNAPATTGSGLVAGYAFNEASGSTVTDASGNGQTGTILEATRTSGKYGGALSFDGVNDWVTVADSSPLDLTTGMTLSAWVYPTALSGWHTVIMKQGAGDEMYTLNANTGQNRPQVAITTSGGLTTLFGTTQLPLNTWTHLAGTYDGSTLRLYVNGSLVASKAVTGSLRTSTGPLRIGGNSLWGEFFRGRIDEVKIYQRALTTPEIQTDAMTSPMQ